MENFVMMFEHGQGVRSVIRRGTISQGKHVGKDWMVVFTGLGDYELFIGGELYAFASSLDVVLDELYFLENA